MSLGAWITAGKDTMKAEDVPLTSDRSSGRWQFPAGSMLGLYRSTGDWFEPGVRRDRGLVVIWGNVLLRGRCSRESPCTTNTHG
jgi:hypothetical protein